MFELKSINVVVETLEADGRSEFADVSPPVAHEVPGVIAGAYVWGTTGTVSLPENPGGVPTDASLPEPGDTRFGFLLLPPKSAGKLDMRIGLASDEAVIDVDEADPSLHRTATIDYEVVLSGKVDVVLQGGATRTLEPGSCLIMGGAMHSWHNKYDEPCICALVMIGAVNGSPRHPTSDENRR